MPRPIIYFGSSFNPITHAHMDMIKHMLREASKKTPRPIVLLAPVYSHILTSKPGMAQYEDRFKMTELAAKNIVKELNDEGIQISEKDFVVSTVDKDTLDAKKVQGTLPVLEFMKENAQKYDLDVNDISLVLGNDTYEDILGGVWNKAEEIFGHCKNIHVFDRDNKPVLTPHEAVAKAEKFCNEQVASQPEDKLKFIRTRLERLPAVNMKAAMLGNDYFIVHKDKVREEHRTTSSTKIRNDFIEASKGVAAVVLKYMEEHPWTYQATDHLVGIFVSKEDKNCTGSPTLTFIKDVVAKDSPKPRDPSDPNPKRKCD